METKNTTNEHFAKSVNDSAANFVNFVKINTREYSEEELKDINYLAQRVALNMYYFEGNINTAKSDYISLLGMLIQKGVIFSEFKDLVPDTSYPYGDFKDGDLDFKRMKSFVAGEVVTDVDLFQRHYPISGAYRAVEVLENNGDKIMFRYVRTSYSGSNVDCRTLPMILYYFKEKLLTIKP